ncbi:MAG TPA: type II toxin-antitoxin system PemK/MazF family toxin [Bacteroidia bacterium]|nr:type II toxin-antitoxin system PemK/MazF family toxin [Bacteroidia bacterium]
MNKGDIILVPFPFTDLSGNKLRPALILSVNENDVTVAFITTQLHWREVTDVILQPSLETGLKKESIIRLSKLATLDKELILGQLGKLDSTILENVNRNLKNILKLDG